MTPWDAVYEELRKLRKALEGERQRRGQTLMTGTVESVEGARVKVRLTDDGEDGPIVTMPLRMAGHTGKRGGGIARFARLGVGEAVMVISPNGELGPMSAVVPWIDTEDDPSPGKAETHGEIVEKGAANREIKDDLLRERLGEGAAAPRVTVRTTHVKLRFGDHYLFVDERGVWSSVPPAPAPDPEPAM